MTIAPPPVPARRSRRLAALAVAGLSALACTAAPAAAAIAPSAPIGPTGTTGTTGVVVQAAAQDGDWYRDAMELDLAHQQATGEGITVAVIDFAINPDAPDLAGADVRTRPDAYCSHDGVPEPAVSTGANARHATVMTALVAGSGGPDGTGIRGVAPDATVLHYAVAGQDFDAGGDAARTCDPNDQRLSLFGLALEDALADGADIVSVSTGGSATSADAELVAQALARDVILVLAAPGTEDRLYGYRDGTQVMLNGAVVVEAAGGDGMMRPDALAHPFVSVAAPGVGIKATGRDGDWSGHDVMNGSSPAAAITSGALATVWSAHPDATADQIVQTLLRHTFQNDGEAVRHDDVIGYGTISLRNMLDADPTAYPDENPLVRTDPDARPSAEQIAAARPADDTTEPAPDEPVADPTDEAEPAPPADGSDDAAAAGVPIAWVVAAVVLVILVVLAVVLTATRRRQRPSTGGGPR